jgi:hypothetical protein
MLDNVKKGFVPNQRVVTIRICRPMHRALKALGSQLFSDGLIDENSMNKALTIVLHQTMKDYPEMRKAYDLQLGREHPQFTVHCSICCNRPDDQEVCENQEECAVNT